ncbi:putative holin [Marinobacter sp. OP 3.4]|uniref:putative holin n=1 Tax=Marinobacter sp. OP 3.4 TaxID=3076501 RepID=UPI002E1F6844
MDKQTFLDKFRAGPWLIVTIVMAAVVGFLYPHQLGVLLWSLTKLSAGAYLGYWIDRSIFYYGRPGDICHKDIDTALLIIGSMMRRALIMAAAILALGLGV